MAEEIDARIAEVEAHSAGLRKELGLRDLVLVQIMYVVGSAWVGTAAKLGTAHIAFWLLAIALFYVPQAIVVIYLNRRLPVEGGLYQWARVGLGPFAGFLTAWNLWVYALTILATFAVIIAKNLSYLLPASIATAGWYTPVTSIVSLAGVTLVSIYGLRVGKWLQRVGAVAYIVTFAALIVAPFVAVARGSLGSYDPLDASRPDVSLDSLNIFGKMALGALSGFEYVAILAGECRDPRRTIGRSVVLGAPIIAVMFILGTSSVLALVPRDVDLVAPIPQTLQLGFTGSELASAIGQALIGLLLLRQIGNVTLLFAGTTRLPMVAGWDGLLPAWFTRLHPRLGTPINSILFVGALALGFCLVSQVGVGVQEAFQYMENVAGILYAFTYLALFAIVLFATRRSPWRPPAWLRVVAASGIGVTALYCVLSIFPIIEVASPATFAVKIVAVLVAIQLIGVALYRQMK